MKKITKAITVILVIAMITAFASVSAFAVAESEATPVSISVKTEPSRTVYYEDVDTWDDMLFLDATGMVITVTNSDGTTFDVSADDGEVYLDIDEYELGENEATVYYYTDDYEEFTTTLIITVEENPVESVEITKMPTKTEYDIEKDVLTAENFDFDELYASDPETFDEILDIFGMTYDDVIEMLEDEEMMEMVNQLIFSEYSEILLIDTEGMEIEVTFKDGTSVTLTDEDEYAVYNGVEIPVMVGQVNSRVTEGVNVLYVDVAGVEAEFEVTVVRNSVEEDPSAPATPNESNPQNPVIPNTDGGVSLVAASVIAIASACGIALVPSKKKEQF